MKHFELDLGSITAKVVQKKIRNVHLSVYPPLGEVRIAAPDYMSLDAIRVYAVSKLPWIKQQQHKFQQQARESDRLYISRESHYVWGQRYLLEIMPTAKKSYIEYCHTRLTLYHRTQTDQTQRDALVAAWYRQLVREQALLLIERWQPILGVSVSGLYISKMKTRWGSCSPERGNIRLNTELAKKPKACLEYIVLHELLHLIDPTHGYTFTTLLDLHMPDWSHRRRLLNELPIHG